MTVDDITAEEVLSRLGLTYFDTGDHYKLICPFHDEKEPSFSMLKTTTQYQCFGCGVKGNWYSLIKELTGSNPYRYMGITKEDTGDSLFYKALNKVLSNTSNVDEKPVKEKVIPFRIIADKEHPFDNTVCRDYCLDRGLTKTDIKEFDIFYISSGFIGDYSTKFLDFSERLVIPIYDEDGIIVAYEGRDVTNDPDKIKCLYPKKSKVGYTLFNLKNLDVTKPTIMVEGFFDVISTRKAIQDVFPDYQVTTYFGTQMSKFQIDIVNRFENVILLLDPDTGGKKGVESFDKYYTNDYEVAWLDSEHDPNKSTVKEIVSAIENRLSKTEYWLKENGLLQSKVTEW